MNRSDRQSLARETLSILEQGGYTAPAGHFVDLRTSLDALARRTVLYAPEELAELARAVDVSGIGRRATIDVTAETTLAAAARLVKGARDPLFVLNFASAKNPGGGFLNGSEAQEESLTRSSALYSSLLKAERLYQANRECGTNLYLDSMIFSPGTPVFRDDSGALLDAPYPVSFLTAPAANAGALATSDQGKLPDVMLRRTELVLSVAAARGYSRLVLGAWGCGVFRNDPAQVAGWFAEHLFGRFEKTFSQIVFAIHDRTEGRPTLAAFEKVFEKSSCV